jgi:hypothetical protein
MKKVRVDDGENININSDLIEYSHSDGVIVPSKKKRVCMVIGMVGAISLCIFSVILLAVIAILYGLIQGSIIPWGNNYCRVQFAIPNKNITGIDLFSRYHRAFELPPYCNLCIFSF